MPRPNLPAAADRAFAAFMNYLHGLSDLTTTEETITAPIERQYLEGDLDEVETKLEALWTTINDIVWQIPHDHPWQDKLVLLLSALAERPHHLAQSIRSGGFTCGRICRCSDRA